MSNTAESAQWRVTAIRYASRSALKSKSYLNYAIYDEPDAEIGMDYFFWLLDDGEHTVLVDTGFNERSGPKHGKQQLATPRALLEALGVDRQRISHVVLSHLHYDHAGNLDLAPNAQFFLSRDDLEFWTSSYGSRELFASATEDEDVAAVVALRDLGRLTLTEGDVEILPGLRVMQVGGHTPGQVLVLVETAAGTVILASDAIHYYEELERARPFLHIADVLGAYDCFDAVARMIAGGAILVPGHDPLVLARFAPVAGMPEGSAVDVTSPLPAAS